MQLKLKFFMILALLFTTMTAGAYNLTLDPNYEGAESGIAIPVDYGLSGYQYSLTNFNPANYPQYIRDGHSIVGWAETSTGPVIYEPNATVTLTGDLMLYAVWDFSLKYTLSDGNPKTAQLTGYFGNKPTGALVIPASVTIGGNSYAVTSIGNNAFSYCNGLISVTLNSNPTIGAEAFPAGAAVTMNLTANTAEGAKWMTFYNEDYNFQADANTQVFKAELSGTTITLHEVTDKIVNANTGVVLKTTGGGNPVMTMTTTESNDTQANSLLGVDDEAGKTAPNPSTMFVLNNGSAGVGFYKLASGKKLGVGKAYLQTTSSSNFFGMEDDETTSISEELRVKSEELNSFFDLSGRKVTNPKKGIFIHNGRKEVIR